MSRILLNNQWHFYLNLQDEQYEIVDLPHTVKLLPYNYLNEKDYQQTSRYIKTFPVKTIKDKEHFLLTFEGVAHHLQLYINRRFVAEHCCGYDSFTIEITEFLLENQENEILAIVDSHENLNIPPFGKVIDYLTYGGIYREVYLDIKQEFFIQDLFIQPFYQQMWGFHLQYQLNLNVDHVISYELFDYEGKCIFKNQIDSLVDQQFFEQIFPWSIQHPNLYILKSTLFVQGIKKDEMTTRFGFRTCQFKKDGFYLNGEKVKIIGLNRHQSYPYVGYAMPKSMQVEDARILKEELSVNAVRTSHYFQSKYFIDACDELGLLVFTEIPGWQHIGDARWKEQALLNTENMILQYRNHPSIILWGVRINESFDCDELYLKTNQLAHQLDPTRMTAGVKCYKKCSELEDVYTFNDFLNPHAKRGLSKKKQVVKNKKIPYLVSEFNGHMFPTKSFDDERHRLEQLKRYAKVLNECFKDEEISGCFGWCMADYNTHKDFGSGDKICYHGVLDMFRNKKLPAYLYEAMQEKHGVLILSSTMNIGDHPAGIIEEIEVITNAEQINLYKNEEKIAVFFAENSDYPHLKHPPIKIDDLIGNQLEVHEKLKPNVSRQVKEVIKAYMKHGFAMPLKNMLQAINLLFIHHLSFQKVYEFYNRYVSNWGSEHLSYRLEAVNNGKIIKNITIEPFEKLSLSIQFSATTFVEETTYDVIAVRIQAIDQNGLLLPYYQEALHLSVSGPIQIIGPDIISLKGGMGGTYLKSLHQEKEAMLRIENQSHTLNYEFSFQIKITTPEL